MTTPASGAITFADLNTEIGNSSTAQISLNDANVRKLAGIPSGAISMNDLRGKTMYWRASSYSNIATPTGGSVTDPTYAYDGSSISYETSTGAVIGHSVSGDVDDPVIIEYTGWGTGTFTGNLNIVVDMDLYDSAVEAVSWAQIWVNGSMVGNAYSSDRADPITAGSNTYSWGTGNPYQISLSSVNLATLAVQFRVSGGRILPLVDGNNCYGSLWVKDMVLLR